MRKITWLTGDYANVNDRQNQAAARCCAVTVDFHFNGNGADAKGGEVWYKPGDARAKMLGQAIVDAYSDLDLPFHGNEPLKEAVGEFYPALRKASGAHRAVVCNQSKRQSGRLDSRRG